MKLGTQPVTAQGSTAFSSSVPTVLPTNPNSPFAKLVVKSEVGQVVQQWLLLQNKCTLGSASSCALRCQLSGIAPYHALLVRGARQVFIRALAPKLSRNGVAVNELLLTEDQCTFEIAGHQFELIRNVKPSEANPSASNHPATNKMKFTLARPMEIGQVRQPAVAPPVPPSSLPLNFPRYEQSQPSPVASPELQPQWITDLIQSAMQPLERQLNGIIAPLAAVQNELDKRAKLERKRRNRSSKRPTPELLESSRADSEQVGQESSDQYVAPQNSASFESTTLQNSFTTQIDVQPQIARLPEPVIVPIISPEVESQLARQNETLDSLTSRLSEMRNNLGSLERVVSQNFVTVIDAASAAAKTPGPVNEALERITSVADQLKGLTFQLEDVKGNLGSLQQIVSDNLASTNELRNAPTPASSEALQRLTDVANQLSVILQEINGRQLSSGEVDSAWRDRLQTQIGELRDTVRATESSVLSVTESAVAKATQAAALSATESDRAIQAALIAATEAAIEKATQAAVVAATESAIQKVNELRASEARQATPKGTCPTSAALIANGHLNATIVSEPSSRPVPPAIVQPVHLAAEIERAPVVEPLHDLESAREAAQITMLSDSEVESNRSYGLAEPIAQSAIRESNPLPWNIESTSTDAPNELVEQLPGKTESPGTQSATGIEQALNLFNQYSWNPDPAEEISSVAPVAQFPAPQSAAIISDWDASPLNPPVQATEVGATEFGVSSANFIEETIEDVPVVEESSSTALPSWWTEDDKTQFRDDSSASAALSSAWNVTSNPVSGGSESNAWGAAPDNDTQDYSSGFTRDEFSASSSTSAWDLPTGYQVAQVGHEVAKMKMQWKLRMNHLRLLKSTCNLHPPQRVLRSKNPRTTTYRTATHRTAMSRLSSRLCLSDLELLGSLKSVK